MQARVEIIYILVIVKGGQKSIPRQKIPSVRTECRLGTTAVLGWDTWEDAEIIWAESGGGGQTAATQHLIRRRNLGNCGVDSIRVTNKVPYPLSRNMRTHRNTQNVGLWCGGSYHIRNMYLLRFLRPKYSCLCFGAHLLCCGRRGRQEEAGQAPVLGGSINS